MWVVFAEASWLAEVLTALSLLGDCRQIWAVHLPPTSRGKEHGDVALGVPPAGM